MRLLVEQSPRANASRFRVGQELYYCFLFYYPQISQVLTIAPTRSKVYFAGASFLNKAGEFGDNEKRDRDAALFFQYSGRDIESRADISFS